MYKAKKPQHPSTQKNSIWNKVYIDLFNLTTFCLNKKRWQESRWLDCRTCSIYWQTELFSVSDKWLINEGKYTVTKKNILKNWTYCKYNVFSFSLFKNLHWHFCTIQMSQWPYVAIWPQLQQFIGNTEISSYFGYYM